MSNSEDLNIELVSPPEIPDTSTRDAISDAGHQVEEHPSRWSLLHLPRLFSRQSNDTTTDTNNNNLDDSQGERSYNWFEYYTRFALSTTLRFYGMSFHSPIDELVSKILIPNMCLFLLVIIYSCLHTRIIVLISILVAQSLFTRIGNDTVVHFHPMTSLFTLSFLFSFYDSMSSLNLFTWQEVARTLSWDIAYAPPAPPHLLYAIGYNLRADLVWKHATIVAKVGALWLFMALDVRHYNRSMCTRTLQCIEYVSRLIRTIAPFSRWLAYFPLPPSFGQSLFFVLPTMFIDHGLPLWQNKNDDEDEDDQQFDGFANRFFIAHYAKYKLVDITCAFYFAVKSIVLLVGAISRRHRKVKFTESEECPVCYDIMESGVQLECRHQFCERCIDRWSVEHRTCPVCRRPYEIGLFVELDMNGTDGHTQLFPRIF